jgi:NAD(P)-dependent dehydrogenase (short-subunit alcohol dehydrogenase family)
MPDAPAARSVLVTGTSTGIGHATARALDARGWRVYAGVRTEGDAARLRAVLSLRSKPVLLDVRRAGDVAAVRATIAAETGDALDALVNNAGIVMLGAFETLAPEAIRDLYDVNVFGAFELVRAFAPLVRRARGRIVNVGSVSGRATWPFNGVYASSKFALRGFTDALRVELQPFGVRTILIEPGVFRTAIWRKGAAPPAAAAVPADPEAAAFFGQAGRWIARSMAALERTAPPPGPVARAIVRALTVGRPAARYVVGTDAHLQLALDRLPPNLRAAVLGAAMKAIVRRSS